MSNKRKQTSIRNIFALLTGIGLFVFALTLPFLLNPAQTQAAVPWDFNEKILQCGVQGEPECKPCDIFETIKNVIEIALTLAGSIAILVIIIAGTIYIIAPMSGAMAKKRIKMAKQTIISALVGFGLIAVAWGLVNTVTVFLGFSEDWFTIDCQRVNALLDEPDPISTPARSYYCNINNFCVAAPSTVPAGTTVYNSSNCNGVCPSIVNQQDPLCEDIDAAQDRLSSGGTVCNNSGSCQLCDTSAYEGQIAAAAAKYNIDARFIRAIIKRESSCNTNSDNSGQNSDGSVDCGLMGVNSKNFLPLGLTCQDLKNPDVGIDLGTKILSEAYRSAQSLSGRYGATVTVYELAAAIHNAGFGESTNSADCTPSTGWPTIPKWGCPINPGTAEFNACDIRDYACNVGACMR